MGGPATAEGAWIAEFIDFCVRKGVPLDFISTHNYPGDGIGEAFSEKQMQENIARSVRLLAEKGAGRALDGMRTVMADKSELSEMPKGQMRESARAVQEIVGGRYPVYYTEWNCNAILTSSTNDTRKAACFQVKGIDEMESFVTGSSIWAFSDIFDEFMIVPDTFSGGFGLLTVDGIPKPQFYALKLMRMAGERKYELPYTNGEVELAVYENDGEKQIFVYRQRMKNVDEPTLPYQIRLEQAKAPARAALYRIDETHCNPLRIWEEKGRPQDLNRQQAEEIIAASSLQREDANARWQDGYILMENTIGVNDIHCYIIALEKAEGGAEK